MASLIVDLSISLDGYIAGADDGPSNPLGGGVRLLEDAGRVDLEQVRVIESDGVTHLRYRVVR